MIRCVLIQNRSGKTRFSKWFVPGAGFSDRLRLEQEIHKAIVERENHWCHILDNFRGSQGNKVVYRQYADLLFIISFDEQENELSIYEFIHAFVEVLDEFFGDVRELDLNFNFHRVHRLLDEMVVGGEIIEWRPKAILDRIRLTDRME